MGIKQSVVDLDINSTKTQSFFLPNGGQNTRSEILFQKTDLVTNSKSYSEIKKTFEQYDKDNNGFIEGKEFKDFIRDIADQNHIAQGSIEDVFESFDTNHDGKISFEEFIALLSKLNPQKILILGTGESGKSTLFKQFQLYDNSPSYPYSKGHFLFNLYNYITILASECMDDQNVVELNSKLQKLNITEIINPTAYQKHHEQVIEILKNLWNNKTIQECYQIKLKNYEVPEYYT